MWNILVGVMNRDVHRTWFVVPPLEIAQDSKHMILFGGDKPFKRHNKNILGEQYTTWASPRLGLETLSPSSQPNPLREIC